jgi:hypothetical protein
MKLCFVSVNGPREPYLLDEPRMFRFLDDGQKILFLFKFTALTTNIFTTQTQNLPNEQGHKLCYDERFVINYER